MCKDEGIRLGIFVYAKGVGVVSGPAHHHVLGFGCDPNVEHPYDCEMRIGDTLLAKNARVWHFKRTLQQPLRVR